MRTERKAIVIVSWHLSLTYTTELARTLDVKQRRHLTCEKIQKSLTVRLSHRKCHFDRQVARQLEKGLLVQPIVAAITGNLAESRSTRYPHLAGPAQQPIVKQFTMVTLPFEHEDTKQHALRHGHSLRQVAIPRTVITSDPAKWLVM